MNTIIEVIKWESYLIWIYNADGWWIQYYNGGTIEKSHNIDHDKVACDCYVWKKYNIRCNSV